MRGQVVDRDRSLNAVRYPRNVMILQVATNATQIMHHRHADRLQVIRRPDTGYLQ